ncbi:phosphatase PAP2 family protein [Microlunatus ginsengisoli]|uniref:Phosphatase PAP2 family protein n=1 Tax=Microlunatus ginsengisoli TaxID=363863 RepID=A0ABP7AKQ5_9ACTN
MSGEDDTEGDPAATFDEPATEEYIGKRDITRWSGPQRHLVSAALWLGRYTSAHSVLLITSALGAAIAVLLTWATEEIYDSVKAADGLSGLDQPALDLAISLRTPTSVTVAKVLTNLGGPIGLTIITISIALIMTVRWRSRTPFLLLAIGTAGSLLMTTVGKDLVGRSRPPQAQAVAPYETSPSFPSGHALNNTVVACLVAYLLLLHLASLLARIITVTLAVVWFVAIGLTRVFLGYHWLTDVMAGWLLGLAWTAMVITSHRIYLTVRRHNRIISEHPHAAQPSQD